VYAIETGQVASYDLTTPFGWHDVAAVPQRGTLELNSRLKMGPQSRPMLQTIKLDGDPPLCIGFGQKNDRHIRDSRI